MGFMPLTFLLMLPVHLDLNPLLFGQYGRFFTNHSWVLWVSLGNYFSELVDASHGLQCVVGLLKGSNNTFKV
jgi:hypothetical protein